MVNQIGGCDREGSAPQVSRRSVGSRWINVGRLWAVAVCRPQAAHMFAAFERNPRAVHTESGQVIDKFPPANEYRQGGP